MDETGAGHGPQQPDIRQRVGATLFRAIGPLIRLLLRRGLPPGPNVLLVVRGRVSGRRYATPVAILQLRRRCPRPPQGT